MMTNEELAEALIEIANALEERQENPYRIRAYLRAANSLKHYPDQVSDMVATEADLTIIPKIGVHIAERLKRIILTGNLDLPIIKPAQNYPEKLQKKQYKPKTFRIYSLMFIIEKILQQLQSLPYVKKIQCASDYRRKKEVVSDVEIVIVTDNAKAVFKEFHQFVFIKYIISTLPNSNYCTIKIGNSFDFSLGLCRDIWCNFTTIDGIKRALRRN